MKVKELKELDNVRVVQRLQAVNLGEQIRDELLRALFLLYYFHRPNFLARLVHYLLDFSVGAFPDCVEDPVVRLYLALLFLHEEALDDGEFELIQTRGRNSRSVWASVIPREPSWGQRIVLEFALR